MLSLVFENESGRVNPSTSPLRMTCCCSIRVPNLKFVLYSFTCSKDMTGSQSWLRGTVVERRSLAGELSLSCTRPAADA